ncbi:2'-5' RNA ligase [Noviherbaspirillum humi]|uniref:RNA 2',3'-cyclic phosphodiesterase n=1 Tax=Noviherbaspirillum humi TaxID=1688639 RepID=A0A239E039_9BURK|nr:RNA 2',3'-cyclic phosphodiesterase [Noviherbaspirillum humi]SNS38085.1 2'-5' RNA ligase [Noviherbaspirillum humi]
MPGQAGESLRLFYALWPDDNVRASLMGLQTLLQGRIVPQQNLHITLAFLGQQPAGALPALKDILRRLPKTRLGLTVDRMAYFNGNRIAWAGMHQTPEALFGLQRELARLLKEQGIACDDKGKFKPHVTLARDAAPPPDTFFTPFTWEANRVALVQSLTKAGGPVYTVLAERAIDQDVTVQDAAGAAARES